VAGAAHRCARLSLAHAVLLPVGGRAVAANRCARLSLDRNPFLKMSEEEVRRYRGRQVAPPLRSPRTGPRRSFCPWVDGLLLPTAALASHWPTQSSCRSVDVLLLRTAALASHWPTQSSCRWAEWLVLRHRCARLSLDRRSSSRGWCCATAALASRWTTRSFCPSMGGWCCATGA